MADVDPSIPVAVGPVPEPSPPGPGISARSRKVQMILGALALSAVSIAVSSRFTREPPPPTPVAAGMKVDESSVSLLPDAPQWKVLKVAKVAEGTDHWSDAVPARVKIDETKASKVHSPLAGRVTGVYVELGQTVKTGDPLFAVSSADIAGLRAEREKAAVDVEVAKTTLDRARAMVQARSAPAKDELEASLQHRQAMLSLRLAQSKLASLKVNSQGDNEFTVVSPRDGIVVEKAMLPSQQVQPDASLVAVADLSSVWVVADLFEADAIGIEEGATAKITTPSIPELSVDATVEMVSAVVDPTRHTVPVRVRIDNPDRRLRPNVFAQMRFLVKPPPGSVEVASTALVSDGAKQYVYIQSEQGHFQKREVVAGSARDGRTPVFKGLESGDSVVEAGAILLDNQIALSH